MVLTPPDAEGSSDVQAAGSRRRLLTRFALKAELFCFDGKRLFVEFGRFLVVCSEDWRVNRPVCAHRAAPRALQHPHGALQPAPGAHLCTEAGVSGAAAQTCRIPVSDFLMAAD